MRIDFLIHENCIDSAVQYLLIIGDNPTLKKVKSVIKQMVYLHGESWITEPTIDEIGFNDIINKSKAMIDIETGNIDWENVILKAKPIAEKYYDLIF